MDDHVSSGEAAPAEVAALRQRIRELESAQHDSAICFEHMLEAISDHVYVSEIASNGQWRNLFVSDKEAVMLGYPTQPFRDDPDLWLTLIHADDRPAVDEHVDRLRAGQNSEIEYRMVRADGATIWVRDSVLVYDGPDDTLQVYGVISDVTARKTAHLALETNERFLQSMFESIEDGITVLDRDLRIVRANRWIREHFASGRDPSGQQCYAMMCGHQTVCGQCPAQLVLQTGEPRTAVLSTSTGQDSPGWVEFSAFPLRDNQDTIIGVIEYARDITERKQADEALRQLSQFRQAIIDTAHMLVVVIDRHMRVLVWNKAAESITGYSREEVLGTTNAVELTAADSENAQQAIDDIQAVLSGIPLEDRPFAIRTKQGLFKTLSFYGRPLHGLNGEPAGIVGVAIDVTEQLKAQQRAIELATERERLRVLRQLIRDISHDLKTPVTTLKLSQYLLEKSDTQANRQKQNNVIRAQVQHLESLLEDLLSVARYDHVPAITRQTFDIDHFLAEIAGTYRTLAMEQEQTFATNFTTGPLTLSADRSRLTDALTNIVKNALIYTPRGGSITLHSRKEDHTLVISVTDTGPGIGALDLPHIFDPFYRADPARSADKGGMGLGLAIAKRIVLAHRGDIQVESALGKGSTFSIILPLDENDT